MMHKSLRRRFFRVVLLLGCGMVLAGLIPLVLRQTVAARYTERILDDPEDVPPTRIAIVFGAAVRRQYPTPVLQDRLDAAIQLYHLGRVSHLILSGVRTYDTCLRARTVYEASEAILVTQAYHLPRALFTCQMLGIDALGYAADRRTYRDARWYQVRETMALTVAFWELLGTRPIVTGLGQADGAGLSLR